jgi:Raf kinase inhibitor-like YbhB/YbcL family protein
MRKSFKLILILLLLVLFLAGCGSSSQEKTAIQKEKGSGQQEDNYTQKSSNFVLTSSAFKNGGQIPTKYCMMQIQGGQNISPPLSWSDPPKGTKSFALFCVDTHPIANNWIHWAVVNIPADWRGIEEGASGTKKMKGALELKNSYGFKGWGGPMPPEGSGVHNYEFHLLALPYEKADLPTIPNTSVSLLKHLQKEALAESVLVGTYKR